MFLTERVDYLEDKNREQLLQIEDLASAAENLSSMATKNNQLLEKVDSSLSTISDQCKKVSKRTSKIKKNGKEVLSVTTSAPTMDVNAAYLVELLKRIAQVEQQQKEKIPDTLPAKESDFVKDVKKLMANREFTDFLSTKMIALIDTPKVQKSIRSSAATLMDKKQFDSSNLSDQAKDVIKSWAKDVARKDFLDAVEGSTIVIKTYL